MGRALMDSKKKKPWLRSDGSFLSGSELITISKDWDKETWEDYLSCVVDVKRSESFISQQELESIPTIEQVEEESPHSFPAHILNSLSKSLLLLPSNQQQIIHFIFWEHKSLREIAQILNISFGAVRKNRDQAIKNLKIIMKSEGTQLPYVGEMKLTTKKGETNEIDI